jgi:RHS repeat-associated protein
MSSTGRILERVTYSAYGVATRHPVADFNRDGFTDFFDDLAYDDCYTGSGGGCPSGQTADMNLDGFVDSFDYDEWDLSYAEQVNTARGVLSQNDASAAVNHLGYAGYFFEPATQQYLVRHREYDPNVGTWDERDPMGYHDGADLYMYVRDNPVTGWDPMGLRRQNCGDNERCGGPTNQQHSVTKQQPDRITPISTRRSLTKEECQICLEGRHDDAIIIELERQFAQSGCPLPLIICGDPPNSGGGTCSDPNYREGGYNLCGGDNPQNTLVGICHQKLASCDEVIRVLRHEMQHALDCCRGLGGNLSECDACVCNEIRANRRDQGCVTHRPPNMTEDECLARRACISCRGRCSSNIVCMESANNQMYDCFPDS